MNLSVSHHSSNIVVHLRRPQDTIRIVRTDIDIVKREEREEAKRSHPIWTTRAGDRWRGTCVCVHSGLGGSKVNKPGKQNKNDPSIVRAAHYARAAVVSLPVLSRTT